MPYDPHDYHSVGDKYIRAVVDAMGAAPVLLPALADQSPYSQWLSSVDGILFTGAYSNVEPTHYSGAPSDAGTKHDPVRDATTLPLVQACIDSDTPLFGVCRGFQEINVALGGTLYQNVHLEPHLIDHREDTSDPLEVQYGAAHTVELQPEGYLFGELQTTTIKVNSVHQQGVNRLAPGLQIECTSEDGLIEGFSLENRERFLLGVQWHPEWNVCDNTVYQKIFNCFTRACVARKYR